jgi:hypothetical protein
MAEDPTQRRSARSDLATVARLRGVDADVVRSALRSTDQVVEDGSDDTDGVAVLLVGCDEVDAHAVLARLGVTAVELRIAERHDLLAGPARRRTVEPVAV